MVLVYHNITPSDYFVQYEPHFAAKLHWGRHELHLLRDKVRLATAVSKFNADDLSSLGYRDVHVVSAGLQPSRLHRHEDDAALKADLQEKFPHGYLLAVAQLLPHKRLETIVQALHLTQWIHDCPLGLVVVGTPRMPQYRESLERYAAALKTSRVWFFGAARDDELATCYRGAQMYISASAHEGLALPPLEAMSFGRPVIVRDAGALRETVGDAGLVLPAGSGPMLMSEAITRVYRSAPLQQELGRRGTARVSEIERHDPSSQFVDLLNRSGLV